jgi:hypothetical protein
MISLSFTGGTVVFGLSSSCGLAGELRRMGFPPSFFDLCLDICTYRVETRDAFVAIYVVCGGGGGVVHGGILDQALSFVCHG